MLFYNNYENKYVISTEVKINIYNCLLKIELWNKNWQKIDDFSYIKVEMFNSLHTMKKNMLNATKCAKVFFLLRPLKNTANCCFAP